MQMNTMTEMPHDLCEQALKLAHKRYTARLPYEYQEDFRNEVVVEILERWHEYIPQRCGGAKMSVWIDMKIRKVWKNFTRRLTIDWRRYVLTDFGPQGTYNDDRVSDEVRVFRQAPSRYREPEPEADIDAALDRVRGVVTFTSVEEQYLELKINGWKLARIAAELHQQADELDRMSRVVRKKIRAAKIILDQAEQPQTPFDSLAKVHEERGNSFPETPFRVSVPYLGTQCSTSGIRGVRTASRIALGAHSVRQDCDLKLRINPEHRVTALAFWDKYGGIVRHCSRLRLSTDASAVEVGGGVHYKEAGADVVWGVMMVEVCNKMKRMRQTESFTATHRDFDQMVANLGLDRQFNGPVFDGARDSWRARI